MPINNLQLQAHEVGRIRLGDKGTKGQPRKLDCFRLTSQNQSLLCAAAKLYGGEVRPWEGHPGHFEVYLTVKELPFMASPVELSQWWEEWSAGGCVRRCDGVREWLSDQPCLCDLGDLVCHPTTRFSVMLYELPGLGVWRMESHGKNAAKELPAEAQWLIESARRGRPVRATLSIEHRQVKKQGEVTKNFIVPVIHTPYSIDQIMSELPAIRRETIAAKEEQKQIAAAPEEAKQTFRQFMLARAKTAFAENNITPTPQNIAAACMVPEDLSSSLFKGDRFAWTGLRNEQLLQASVYASSGIPMADDQAVKDTLESLRHDWGNPPLADTTQDISEDEL